MPFLRMFNVENKILAEISEFTILNLIGKEEDK